MQTALRIETEPNARDKKSASGGSGTVLYAGFLEDPDPNPEVRGSAWYGSGGGIGVASEMMRDPHCKRSVEAIVDPILAAFWDFRPASKLPLDIEAADYARHDFLERNHWERTLRLGTTGVVRDGFVLFEATDSSDQRVPRGRFPLHPGNGLGVGYTKFHHRPASTVERWIQSDRDNEAAEGFVQYLEGADQERAGHREISYGRGDLFFRLAWDQEGADFDGLAPLRAAYGAYKCKRLLMTLSMIRHEREGVGIPELQEPDGRDITPAEEAKAKEVLRALRGHEQAYLYIPGGWKFLWRVTSGQSTGLQEAIEQCNRDIAYNMGVAWMLLGIAGKTGSWALATEQRGHYVLSLEKYARFWEAAINLGMDGWSPVERLIRRNYGPEVGLPRLIARNMPTRDWSKILPLLPTLAKAKLLKTDAVLRAFVRNVSYLPEEDPETAEEQDEEAAMGAIGEAVETEPEDDAEAEAARQENEARLARLERAIDAAAAQAQRAERLASQLFSDDARERFERVATRTEEPA